MRTKEQIENEIKQLQEELKALSINKMFKLFTNPLAKFTALRTEDYKTLAELYIPSSVFEDEEDNNVIFNSWKEALPQNMTFEVTIRKLAMAHPNITIRVIQGDEIKVLHK